MSHQGKRVDDLEQVVKAADSISDGDLLESVFRCVCGRGRAHLCCVCMCVCICVVCVRVRAHLRVVRVRVHVVYELTEYSVQSV